MLKIMLSSVGLHDPFGNDSTEGPIIGAVRELKPDILYLFPTRKQADERLISTEENCRETEEELKKINHKLTIYVRPLNLPDPTDYVNIIKSLENEINDLMKTYAMSEVQYNIAISSATPQIQSAFLVLVNSNRIKAQVYQTIAPRFIEEDGKRTRLVDTHFLEEENQIVRARRFFQNFNYLEASNELFDLGCNTSYPERAEKAEVFSDLLKIYFYWDLYQHKKALKLNIKNKVVSKIKIYRFYKLAEIVEQQIKTMEEVNSIGDKEGYANLVDLYHNALRRLKCKQYVDCLSRFKRLYEGIYYYVAREELGISPSTKVEHQHEWVRKILNKRGNLNIYDIKNLYEYKKNKKIIPSNLENQLNQLANQRNGTINNHGMKSVEKDDGHKALVLIEKLFKHVFKNNINDYCFSSDNMQKVEEFIFNEL